MARASLARSTPGAGCAAQSSVRIVARRQGGFMSTILFKLHSVLLCKHSDAWSDTDDLTGDLAGVSAESSRDPRAIALPAVPAFRARHSSPLDRWFHPPRCKPGTVRLS